MNVRQPNGRFGVGNQFARGNPFNRRAAQIRAVIRDAVSDDDIIAIVQSLVTAARGGDIHAAREILDRLVGRPLPSPPLDEYDAEAARPAALNYKALTVDELARWLELREKMQTGEKS